MKTFRAKHEGQGFLHNPKWNIDHFHQEQGGDDMSQSQNSLKAGLYRGSITGLIKGDARSLDCGSNS